MIKEEVRSDPLIRGLVRESLELWDSPSDDEGSQAIEHGYQNYVRRKWAFMFICIILTFLVVGYSLTIGDYHIEFFRCYEVIWEHLTGNVTNALEDYVIFNLRLPRIEIGVLAGFGLAVAGVVMQSTLMNPLADSYTTGVSSGASLGATLAVVVAWSIGGSDLGIIANAFVFSLVPMVVIIGMSKIKNASPTTMIMGGIAIMYLFSAFTTLFTLMAQPDQLEYLYKWNVGSLGFAGKDCIPIVFAFVFIGSTVLMFLTKQLNVLAAGDESAKALGVNADMMRRICLVITALIVAAVVSFTGTIGFVGLVAPHVIRMVIGPDNRFLLPISGLFGGLLLIIADLIGTTIIAPAILQAGVIMAFLGGPLFLWLILRKNTKVWG